MLITHAANTSTVWKTFSGDAPVAIARGGFSGIFPDSSMIAYKWALLKGLPNMIMWCDVQLTSDGVGICFRELTLDSDSDISNVFNNSKKSYIVNGVSTTGWFSVDFTLSALSNISLSQGVPFRPHEFDSSSFQVVTVGDLAGQLNLAGQLKPPGLWLNIQDDGGKKIELKPGFYMEHDENVGAVVVGFDRYFNYYKVQYGTLCIRENPGCLFIATNRDAVTHLTDAQEWAGGGSMVGALCGSTQQEPLVVGKPSTFMMDYLSDKFGITKSQICMVGDRLDTDILFGQNGGCKTLLVLSGLLLSHCRCYEFVYA